MPKVSFIIPYYNAGATVMETLDSIWAQSFTDYDVWLVNDGSTDAHSLEVLTGIEQDARVKVLHQENAGPSVARNAAIAKSAAEFIVPLDADDLIMPDAVAAALNIAEAEQRVDVVYGAIAFFGDKDGIRPQQPFDIQKQFLWNMIAVTCLIRRSFFLDCGGYDTHLSKLGLEDWEFWIRAHGHGMRSHAMDAPFFSYRIQKDSRTEVEANVHLDEIKAYVHAKHSTLLAKEYEALFYERKMLMETPDYRLGNLLLRPWRIIKARN